MTPISSWTSSRPRSARYSVGSGPIFEQTRATNDKGHISQIVEGQRESISELRGKRGALEQRNQVRVFLAHLFDLHVFAIQDIFQIVVMDKALNPIRGHIPRLWNLHRTNKRCRLRNFLDDLLRQKQTGALPAKFSMAGRRKNQLAQKVIEIFDLDEVLCDVDKRKAL